MKEYQRQIAAATELLCGQMLIVGRTRTADGTQELAKAIAKLRGMIDMFHILTQDPARPQPQAEPVQFHEQERNCGNCGHSGPAYRDVRDLLACSQRVVLGIKAVVPSDCICPAWKPQKTKEAANELS